MAGRMHKAAARSATARASEPSLVGSPWVLALVLVAAIGVLLLLAMQLPEGTAPDQARTAGSTATG